MARFKDVPQDPAWETAEQLKAAHDACLAVEGADGAHFERAWLDAESGKAFCLSVDSEKEKVRRLPPPVGQLVTEIFQLPIQF